MKAATQEQLDAMVRAYCEGQGSIKAVGAAFGYGERPLSVELYRRGIVPKRTSVRSLKSCNRRYFANIDTEEKAYWLGFIAADGYVTGRLVGINLALADKAHLERFKIAISSDYDVMVYKNNGFGSGCMVARILITAPEMVEDLALYGVGINKTTSLTWPDIPENMLRHYLRGYFDGDGCCLGSVPKGRAKAWQWSIVSCPAHLEKCRNFMEMSGVVNSGVAIYPHHSTEKVCNLNYAGNWQVARIVHFMYHGASVYLPRKLEKIAEILLPQTKPSPLGSAPSSIDVARDDMAEIREQQTWPSIYPRRRDGRYIVPCDQCGKPRHLRARSVNTALTCSPCTRRKNGVTKRTFDFLAAKLEYEKGVSSPELAKKYGVNVGTMNEAIRKAGGVIRSRAEANALAKVATRKLSPDNEIEACCRYQDGESLSRIATSFQVSRDTITKTLARNGVSCRSPTVRLKARQ